MKNSEIENFNMHVMEIFDSCVKISLDFKQSECLAASVLYIATIFYNISNDLPFVVSEDGELKNIYKMDEVFDLIFRRIKIQADVFRAMDSSKGVH